MFGMFFLGALYLEQVLGYDALEIGLAFLPATIVMGALSLRYSEPLMTRFGPRAVVIAGLALIGVSLLLFARVPVDGNYVVDILPLTILLGLGAGSSFPALMTLAMSGATPEDAGLASGLVNTAAQVGGALGLALLATVSAGRSESLLEGGAATANALVGGFHLAFIIGAALVAAAVVVGVVVIKSAQPAEAHEAPAELHPRTDPAYAEAA
jgi:MFS family permease